MPHGRAYRFEDPHQLQATLRAGSFDVFANSRVGFDAELIRIDLDRLWMQRCSSRHDWLLRTSNDPKRAPMTFLADPAQSPLHQNGTELPSDGIAVYCSGAFNNHWSHGPSGWASMSLTPEELAKAGQTMAGRELTVPRETYIARPGAALMTRIRRLHDKACHLARTKPEALSHAATAKAFEQELVHAMVGCLTAELPAVRNIRPLRHARMVARFEEFLAAKKYEPVYIGEMCAGIGVSERTLRTCCQEHLGMGPIHYLWLRRMHLARHALHRAEPTTASVTDIAMEYGFWELGRFSVKYRALFGELPSATLRRPPDQVSDRTA